MTADEILAGMAAAYAGCRSYRDRGCVTTGERSAAGRQGSSDDRPFRTAFVRPDRLRFDFSHGYPVGAGVSRYSLLAAGSTVRVWHTLPGGARIRAHRAVWERQAAEAGGALHDWRGELVMATPKESVGLGVATLTGVSGVAAHTVPALLLPGVVGGRSLTDLRDLERLGDAEADGVPCYRVRGRYPDTGAMKAARRHIRATTGVDPGRSREAPQVLWVERATLLLRRVEGGFRWRDGRTQGPTVYEPEADVPIPDAEFACDLPGP
jgi:hypothetical protein